MVPLKNKRSFFIFLSGLAAILYFDATFSRRGLYCLGDRKFAGWILWSTTKFAGNHRETVDFKTPAFWNTFAAMASKLKVNTLEGSVVTVQVMPTNTIQELKAMLHEKKHCEDSIEHKILRVKLMMDGLLVDDDQALEAAGLLHAESEVTVIYSRNEVEAATKEAIHEEGFLQVNIPSSLTRILREPSKHTIRWSGWQSLSLWRPLGTAPLQDAVLWKASLSWLCDGHRRKCLFRLQFFGKHHYPWLCDGHWGRCLCTLYVFGKRHYL